MKTFLSSATPLAQGTGPLYPYDLARAKALLKEAGHEAGFEVVMRVLAGNQDETPMPPLCSRCGRRSG